MITYVDHTKRQCCTFEYTIVDLNFKSDFPDVERDSQRWIQQKVAYHKQHNQVKQKVFDLIYREYPEKQDFVLHKISKEKRHEIMNAASNPGAVQLISKYLCVICEYKFIHGEGDKARMAEYEQVFEHRLFEAKGDDIQEVSHTKLPYRGQFSRSQTVPARENTRYYRGLNNSELPPLSQEYEISLNSSTVPLNTSVGQQGGAPYRFDYSLDEDIEGPSHYLDHRRKGIRDHRRRF